MSVGRKVERPSRTPFLPSLSSYLTPDSTTPTSFILLPITLLFPLYSLPLTFLPHSLPTLAYQLHSSSPAVYHNKL